jgi:hypothetical protein
MTTMPFLNLSMNEKHVYTSRHVHISLMRRPDQINPSPRKKKRQEEKRHHSQPNPTSTADAIRKHKTHGVIMLARNQLASRIKRRNEERRNNNHEQKCRPRSHPARLCLPEWLRKCGIDKNTYATKHGEEEEDPRACLLVAQKLCRTKGEKKDERFCYLLFCER